MRGSRILAAATVTVAAAILPVSPAIAGNSGDNGSKNTADPVTGTGTATDTTTGAVAGAESLTGTVAGAVPGVGTMTDTVPGAVTGTVPGAGTPLTGFVPVTGTSPDTSDLRSTPGVAIITSEGGDGRAGANGSGTSSEVDVIPDAAEPGQPVTLHANTAACRAVDATATAVSSPERLFLNPLPVTTPTTTGLSATFTIPQTAEPGTYIIVVTCTSPTLGSEAGSEVLRVASPNAGDGDDEGGRDQGDGHGHGSGGYGPGHNGGGHDSDDGYDDGSGGYGRGHNGGGHDSDDGYGDYGDGPDTGFGGALGMNLPETLLGASFIVAGTAAGAYLLRRRRENGFRG